VHRIRTVVLSAILIPVASLVQAEKYHLFIGTYTGPKSDGVYVASFDSDTGELGEPKLAAKTPNPTFIAIDPDGNHLYAANEVGRWKGKRGGFVTAFQIDRTTGELKELNQQSTVGDGPCHVVVDKTGKYVLASNYGGGSIASLPVNPDGSLQANTFFAQFTGSSVNQDRQKEPHAHSMTLSPDNKIAFVCDLGTDKLHAFDFTPAEGLRSAHTNLDTLMTPGSGPRHCSFSPDGRNLYVINEMLLTITVLGFDEASHKLTEIQTISTVPEGVSGSQYSTAEVRVHPSGRFVYGSNRGHHSIAAFARDADTGKLTALGQTATGGKTPRNFNIDPSGKFLLVGNQDTDNITLFRIDEATGKLSKMDRELKVGGPVCLRFVSVKSAGN
jgi:6-phosphogluconolactonase